jgi:hypothetical protein
MADILQIPQVRSLCKKRIAHPLNLQIDHSLNLEGIKNEVPKVRLHRVKQARKRLLTHLDFVLHHDSVAPPSPAKEG